MLKKAQLFARNKSSLGLLTLALIVGGMSAQAAGLLNTPSEGYVICVNPKSKVVTHPGTDKCLAGDKKLVLGAQGARGAEGIAGLLGNTGLSGAAGLPGQDGRDGKTLWNGVKDPESAWGAPGDMFINSVTKTLFGPKSIDGLWTTGVSMVGATGAKGDTGLAGAAGVAGAAGASGESGAVGAAGAAGSNATLTCAQGGTCAVGATGPGGGIVFYLQTATAAAPWRYLEAAPYTWYDGSADPQIKFCSVTNAFVPNLLTGSTAAIQTSTAIGAGYSNTQKALRGCSYGAANAAAAYNGGGKSNWFLPSQDELNKLYLAKDTVGGFGDNYWSSSESLAGYAFIQSFNNGNPGGTSKNFTGYVRPVRAF